MKIEIRNEELISCIIELLENNLESANAEIEKLKGYSFENEELYKENERLIQQVAEFQKKCAVQNAIADTLQKTEARLSEVTEKNIVAWDKIRVLEKRNTELEEINKKSKNATNYEDIKFLKSENIALERRIEELTRENLKLSRQLIKFKPQKQDAGELVAELIKEIQLEQKSQKKA